MPYQPVGHRIKVRLEEVSDKAGKEGLLYKPETVRHREQRNVDKGTVMALGPNCFIGFADGTPWCAEGDNIAFVANAGVLMEEDGQLFRIINDEDVYAKEEGAKA